METGNIHLDHCARCHLAICPFEDGYGCPVSDFPSPEFINPPFSIVSCPQCSTPLHQCKAEEHIQDICPKSHIPCPNAFYGCTRLLRRKMIGSHLKDCTASVVVCSREWARKTVSPDDKLCLKQLGKGLLTIDNRKAVHEEELDVALAASDQRLLVESYSYRRKHRVGQRDRIHREHPLVPLRDVFDEKGEFIHSGGHDGDGDSSDEEREVKAAKLRSKKAMFANCYMCQVDPSSQHLHTLGSEAVKFWLGRPVRKWPKQEDKLHRKRGLFIDFSPATVSEDKHILFRKTLYARRCLRVVHRNEVGDHEISQHRNALDAVGELVVRCPNWERGCCFVDSRLRPAEGRLRFLSHVDSVLYTPNLSLKSGDSPYLEMCPPWVFEELANYLPSSSLFTLSMVSRKIRSVLTAILERRQMVEVLWKKTSEGWIENGFKYSFSVADSPCDLSWHPASSLSSHLAECEFSDKKSFEEQRVLIDGGLLFSTNKHC